MFLKANSFQLVFPGVAQWAACEPAEDGKPLLAGAILHSAVVANDVLALAITKAKKTELRPYRYPHDTALGVVPLDRHSKLFALSPDGRRLAWMRGRVEVAVAETGRPTHVAAKFHHAGLHSRFGATCEDSPFQLDLEVGGFRHEFGVRYGEFWHRFTRRTDKPKDAGTTRSTGPLPSGYDGARFRILAGSPAQRYRVLLDRFGQILLHDAADGLLAVFLVRREKAATWTPEGGFWGHPDLIGGPPTPDADKGIALAIRPDW